MRDYPKLIVESKMVLVLQFYPNRLAKSEICQKSEFGLGFTMAMSIDVETKFW